MYKLIDTERQAQQPLDRAASSVLTDRSLHSERASWQQCSGCNEWVEDNNIEYTFECVIGFAPDGQPTVNFELKTRYPAYTCSSCCTELVPPASVGAGGVSDDGEEAEQLCPLHVQAVYMLQGSNNADNMKAIEKGFIVHCPDCGLMSHRLQTQQQVRWYTQQHSSRFGTCVYLQQACTSGTYNSPLAFGGSDGSRPVAPEKVIKELLSRLVVLTACHIVYRTRPPPTPVDQLTGAARAAAAATKDLRSNSLIGLGLEGLQLMPYRAWAVDALSRDSDLLTEANWVRPSLEGLSLDHKPSLLDLVLAPPYIAVAENDAGMTVDKLAVLLLRQQKRQHYGKLLGLATSAATGKQLPAAITAAETTLASMLATDSVFGHLPADERVQQFLAMAGIPSIGDIVYALAQPHVQGRGARNLTVCAVCGMSAAALKRAKRPWALHRCKYCIICTCQSCKQEQQQQHPVPVGSDAAVADQLCLWCQGHPDTQGGAVLLSTRGRPSKHQLLASAEHSGTEGTTATIAGWAGRANSNGNPWDEDVLGGERAQPLQLLGHRQAAATAADHVEQQYDDGGEGFSGDEGFHRSPHQYDLAVKLAMAAAAAGSLGNGNILRQPLQGSRYDVDHHTMSMYRQQQSTSRKGPTSAALATKQQVSQFVAAPAAEVEPAVAPNSLEQELEKLQQLQNELQHLLTVQDLQLATQSQQKHQGELFECGAGRRSSSDDVDLESAPYKRRRTQQQHQDTGTPSEAHAAAVIPSLLQSGDRKATPHGTAGLHVARRGRPPTLPLETAAADTAADSDAAEAAAADLQDVYDSSEVSEFGGLPASPGTAQAADVLAGLMMSAAGPHRDDNSILEAESPYVTESEPGDHSKAAADEPEAVFADGQALPPAPSVCQQQQQLCEVASDPPADAMVAISAASALKQHRQQPSAANMSAAAPAAAVLAVLDQGMARFSHDIDSCCEGLRARSIEALKKTLQDMQTLRRQLRDGHQQTQQQMFMTGLQILAEIVDSFNSLDHPASKAALACGMQLIMPAACCPSSSACSVLEVLICCWFKEVQDTSLTVDHAKLAASKADPTMRGRQQAIAGLCQLTLRLVGQFSTIHTLHNAQQPPEEADVAITQQAVVHLLSGTALLLLHWPDESGVSECGTVPVQWRQCLNKWEGALEHETVMRAAGDLLLHCNLLSSMALKPSLRG